MVGIGHPRKPDKIPLKKIPGMHPTSWKVTVNTAEYRGVTKKSLCIQNSTKTKASTSLQQSLQDLGSGVHRGKEREWDQRVGLKPLEFLQVSQVLFCAWDLALACPPNVIFIFLAQSPQYPGTQDTQSSPQGTISLTCVLLQLL